MKLLLALVLATTLVFPDGTVDDLETGVLQYHSGHFAEAVITLDTALHRLAVRSDDKARLIRAHIYLAASQLNLKQAEKAKTTISAALVIDPTLAVTIDEFPPPFVQFVDQVRADFHPLATPPAPAAPQPQSMAPTRGRSGHVPLVVAAGAALAGGIALVAGGHGAQATTTTPTTLATTAPAPTPTPPPTPSPTPAPAPPNTTAFDVSLTREGASARRSFQCSSGRLTVNFTGAGGPVRVAIVRQGETIREDTSTPVADCYGAQQVAFRLDVAGGEYELAVTLTGPVPGPGLCLNCPKGNCTFVNGQAAATYSAP
jgi:hypothetical protein